MMTPRASSPADVRHTGKALSSFVPPASIVARARWVNSGPADDSGNGGASNGPAKPPNVAAQHPFPNPPSFSGGRPGPPQRQIRWCTPPSYGSDSDSVIRGGGGGGGDSK
mmetsp:Transcript_52601/g.157623  ORF Transcript_52601/g.157623 Transcript_52601/m.157623 type:complete len:110 (-) Transcript_52601:258-587(-)